MQGQAFVQVCICFERVEGYRFDIGIESIVFERGFYAQFNLAPAFMFLSKAAQERHDPKENPQHFYCKNQFETPIEFFMKIVCT